MEQIVVQDSICSSSTQKDYEFQFSGNLALWGNKLAIYLDSMQKCKQWQHFYLLVTLFTPSLTLRDFQARKIDF